MSEEELEEIEYPSADSREQAVLMALGAAFVVYGGYTVNRFRRRWLPLWLGGLLVWGTLCKYLICARCECYGKPCDFCYGGKYAALFFKPQPDRTLDASGTIAEGGSMSLIALLPIAAAWGNKRILTLYLFTLLAFEAGLYYICCSKCVLYSKEPWKRDVCPTYKLSKVLNQLLGVTP